MLKIMKGFLMQAPGLLPAAVENSLYRLDILLLPVISNARGSKS